MATLAAAAALAPIAPRWRAAIVATGLITCSALLVHFSGGTIEAHFHFFVVILILALYEDWLPFMIALTYVIAHHGLVGTVAPSAVYNHPDAIEHPWRWALVHAAFVAAAAAGAVVAWRLNEVSRAHAAEATAQAVRSEEANELKSRFIATTSHELRTPLTSIGGFAATLTHRWDQLDDNVKRYLVGIIEVQSARLAELIDDLMLLSKLENGKLRVHRTPIDVRAVAESAVAELDDRDGVAIDNRDGLIASLDGKHVAQIVASYVTNAQKYGEPPIVVAAAERGHWLELTVSDEGSGVSPPFVGQLFEIFDRADENTSVLGTGLGLSIVRGLAQAHGGDAWYEPNAPRGARFNVRFPLYAAAG